MLLFEVLFFSGKLLAEALAERFEVLLVDFVEGVELVGVDVEDGQEAPARRNDGHDDF